MRAIGRVMQILGLSIAPLVILMQLSQSISVGQMLTMFLASVCLFWIGRIIEGYAPK